MNTINRQKFLAELSKLLTFMYEEDRQRALSMYERMFDITEDEQGLIQHLMSPTRQAVIIARAYDAKERKLSVSSQLRGDTDETEESELPKFVLAINKIFDDLFPDSAEDALEEDQVSFFDLGLAQKEDFTAPKPAVPAGAVLLSDTQKFRLDPQNAEAGEPAEADTEVSDEPADADLFPADEPTPVEPDSADETHDFLAGGASIDELITAWKKDLEADMSAETDAPADDAAADVPVAAEELPAQEAEEDANSEELPDSPEEEAPAPEEAPGEEAAAEAADDSADADGEGSDHSDYPVVFSSGPETEAAEEADITGEADAAEETPPDSEAQVSAGSRKTAAAVQEASVPKTVLFLLIAIPVALALLALLLIPTLLFVGVSAGLIILGATLAVSAFSGFSVLADLLLLIGAALVTLALGLLFLWLTVWTIGGGMGGVIRTIGDLHRKLCMKKGVSEE
ncbi:MAG: hypothetical protein J6P42_00755 [Oscillospiraceae bacterium]|nr:hypothetical protein [Oscillospiraceae bacterium]MBO7373916.1 hypothetical protein [Oscillospiraceae bacterium]